MLPIISPKERKIKYLDSLRSGSTRKRIFGITCEWLANFRPHPAFRRLFIERAQLEHSMYRNTGINPNYLEGKLRPRLDGSVRSHGQCRS
jgi:hypothetical protein